jgi:hypothetical protein
MITRCTGSFKKGSMPVLRCMQARRGVHASAMQQGRRQAQSVHCYTHRHLQPNSQQTLLVYLYYLSHSPLYSDTASFCRVRAGLA